MLPKDTILFICLHLMITQAHVIFYPNPICSLREKVEQTNISSYYVIQWYLGITNTINTTI